jgi:hypothetical protein
MNATTGKPESMTIETSRTKHYADITVNYRAKSDHITIDLRQMPVIKIDAIARLYNPNLDFVYMDFRGSIVLLTNVLFNRYNNEERQYVLDVYVQNEYEIVLKLDRTQMTVPVILIRDLKELFKDEAGIVASWSS